MADEIVDARTECGLCKVLVPITGRKCAVHRPWPAGSEVGVLPDQQDTETTKETDR